MFHYHTQQHDNGNNVQEAEPAGKFTMNCRMTLSFKAQPCFPAVRFPGLSVLGGILSDFSQFDQVNMTRLCNYPMRNPILRRDSTNLPVPRSNKLSAKTRRCSGCGSRGQKSLSALEGEQNHFIGILVVDAWTAPVLWLLVPFPANGCCDGAATKSPHPVCISFSRSTANQSTASLVPVCSRSTTRKAMCMNWCLCSTLLEHGTTGAGR